MNCIQTKSLFSPYLDGVLSGSERRDVTNHLAICTDCRQEYASLERTQYLISSLGRKAAPPNLALKLRVAISHEMAMTWNRRLQRLVSRIEDEVNSFMLPATAGLVSAVLMFGLLIGGFMSVPGVVVAGNDIPTSLYMPPRLAAAPFADTFVINAETPVMIEAYVDSKGRLADYRIISGQDSAEVRKQLDRSLIFTVFEPAMSFGRPAPGRVVLSFANVNVKG